MRNIDTRKPFGRRRVFQNYVCPFTRSQRARIRRRRTAQQDEFTPADGLALQAILERKEGKGKTLRQLSEEMQSEPSTNLFRFYKQGLHLCHAQR